MNKLPMKATIGPTLTTPTTKKKMNRVVRIILNILVVVPWVNVSI